MNKLKQFFTSSYLRLSLILLLLTVFARGCDTFVGTPVSVGFPFPFWSNGDFALLKYPPEAVEFNPYWLLANIVILATIYIIFQRKMHGSVLLNSLFKVIAWVSAIFIVASSFSWLESLGKLPDWISNLINGSVALFMGMVYVFGVIVPSESLTYLIFGNTINYAQYYSAYMYDIAGRLYYIILVIIVWLITLQIIRYRQKNK